MQWVFLAVAGAAEITWAVAMKYSAGFTNIPPTIVTLVFYVLSAIFLSLALHKLPLGTAYAIWTGIGIIGTSVLGVFLFQESISALQVACIAMITVGIIGLRLLAQ